MSYSFFGTCYLDEKLTIECIKTICDQSILPKEIVLVNSGPKKIKKNIQDLIKNKNIKLIYIEKNLSRVMSLNYAISKTSGDYLLRFDARSRFEKDYAQNALEIFSRNSKHVYIGGVQKILLGGDDFNAFVSAGILSRRYIFGYPRHRKYNYEGPCNAIYLGCFNASILKNILYREKVSVISEDTLLTSDFIRKGYQPFISSKLKLGYKSRPSILATIRLFNTYGYCRSNTILSSFTIHSPMRYIILFLIFLSFLFFFFIDFKKTIIASLIFIFLYNFLSELKLSKFRFNLVFPLLAIICQLSWLLGFFRGLIIYHNVKSKRSNFIK